jgi:hypothetical protein
VAVNENFSWGVEQAGVKRGQHENVGLEVALAG